jgi:ABC-type amino acid transport system permease subunit
MRFKIIGGTFGNKGNLMVTEQLIVHGDKTAQYDLADVQDVIASKKEVEIAPAWLTILISMVVTLSLTLLFSIIGLIIGLVLTIIGFSRSRRVQTQAEVKFYDGKSVCVTGSKKLMSKIILL